MKINVKSITVLYNLPDTELVADLDTQKTAQGVVQGLKEIGYQVHEMGITTEQTGMVTDIKSDLVFNLIEWAGLDCHWAEDVINNLDKAGIIYTGSNAKGYALSCDKRLMKQALEKNSIPTPKWQIVESADEKFKDFVYPVIVKPTLEHCAIGVSQKSVCTDSDGLKRQIKELISQFHQPALIEEFIAGDEAQVTVLEKNGRPWVLPPAVFRYRSKKNYWPINTYEAKWNDAHWESYMSDWVDDVSRQILSTMQQIAKKCYLKLGGRSYPRMDMRLDKNGQVYVLEVNNNPGFDFEPDSGISYSAKKAGLDWHGLLTNVVEEAYASRVNGYDPTFI